MGALKTEALMRYVWLVVILAGCCSPKWGSLDAGPAAILVDQDAAEALRKAAK